MADTEAAAQRPAAAAAAATCMELVKLLNPSRQPSPK